LLTETMPSPGAATPTHGPAMVKLDGCSFEDSDATDST
jgi:hypothetical protein